MSALTREEKNFFMQSLITEFKKFCDESIKEGYVDDIGDHVEAFNLLAAAYVDKLNDEE